MKLAFVVQRYGADIAGGSEAHCRELAERLAPAHDITVLTTCARDYVTWENAFAPGITTEHGVRVHRFRVKQTRRLKVFAEVSDEVFDTTAPPERQDEWFSENGPDVPELIEHLRLHGRSYDAVFFWTFRYAPSYFGLPVVADRAILLPTAEDDQAMTLDVLTAYFQKPAGYLFLTPEEETLVSARAGRRLTPSSIIGIGLDAAGPSPGRGVLDGLDVPADYVLYLGRIDRNKGCHTLFEYFQEYLVEHPETTLVLAGPTKMAIPDHPRIKALGYVSGEVRTALLAHARVLIVPSPYESLSIVLLEAWNHAVPALVNGRCAVLVGQVRRANGGLFFRSAREFHEALTYLLSQDDERRVLGRQGLAYVEREYRWPTVLARVDEVLRRVTKS